MLRRSFCLLTISILLCSGCAQPPQDALASLENSVKGNVEAAGIKAAYAALKAGDTLSHTIALSAAKAVQSGCATGAKYLSTDGAAQTAEAVNHYVFDLILANLNPAIGAGISTGAAILDDVLKVSPGKSLTAAELAILSAFLKGLSEGAQLFIDGRTLPDDPPATVSGVKDMRPRFWLAMPKQ